MSIGSDPFTSFRQTLEFPLSTARLARYQPSGGGDRETLVNYFWNIALCEALYPTLDALEISLRNCIHAAAANAFGTEFWFDLPGLLLHRRKHPEAIAAARASLSNYQRPQTAGRIIAELRFGFWTSMLTGSYEQHFWKPNNYALLRAAFSSMPYRIRTRKRVHQRYNAIRLLRNRVFHYEPILDRSSLDVEHAEILEAISWISPDLRDSVVLFDRFPDVYSHGRYRVDDTLHHWITPPAPGSV